MGGPYSYGLHKSEGVPCRKGIDLQLLGEQGEIIGEKGTKVTSHRMAVRNARSSLHASHQRRPLAPQNPPGSTRPHIENI